MGPESKQRQTAGRHASQNVGFIWNFLVREHAQNGGRES